METNEKSVIILPGQGYPKMSHQILVIDDKQSIVEVLETALAREGFEVGSCNTGAEAMDAVREGAYDLVLCDVRLPDMDGTEILRAVKERQPHAAVIMITAYGSIENAIECMKLGADDYLTKPFNLEEMNEVVKKALEKVRLVRENIALRAELERKYEFANIIGKSKQMTDIFDLIRRVAPTKVNVLISGETGTGKELVARAIHFNGKESGGPFLALNCAALPENLMESEMFGHVRGAFTGAHANKRGMLEEADGGTLLLDEISELQHPLQAKLLRTLDEGNIRRVGDTREIPTNVRLLFSTNCNLQEAVNAGAFRLDLYHRVRGVEIALPHLRERREDIPLLTEHFLEKISKEHGRTPPTLTPPALALLVRHRWNGNVRELINAVEQMVVLCEEDEIVEQKVKAIIGGGSVETADAETEGLPLKDSVSRLEARLVRRALEKTSGSRR
ncbi:MAG: sigma-54 dependent transcriptional regulator, partial [bacterium]